MNLSMIMQMILCSFDSKKSMIKFMKILIHCCVETAAETNISLYLFRKVFDR